MSEGEKNGSIVGVALRDLDRLRSVSASVAKHGFGELLLKTSLGRRLYRGRNVPEGDASMADLSSAERFSRLLGELGPTFVKLGQILSMRKDIFSEEQIAALESLQDDAPSVPIEQIRAQIERGLGAPVEELFARFEEKPLATASIGQAHRATTHDGEEVIVKVQRPGIEAQMRGDLDLLYLGAQVLEASIDEMRLVGVSDIVGEFERGLLKELNFQAELSNLVTARRNLDPERQVSVPKPYPELSSRIVLTMEFFPGKPVRALTKDSPEAEHAVTEIVHSACKQVFIDGFFHGDPHSGNILVNAEGDLCMIDLGMVGRLSESQRDDLITLIIAAIAGDSGTIARVLLKMGTPTQRVNIMEMRSEIERIRTQYLVVDNIDEVDSAGFIEEFANAAGRFRIKLASEYAILVKAAATIEGVVRGLYPNVDLLGIAQPYIKQIMARRLDPMSMMQSALGEASGLGSTLRTLPAQLDQILHDFETGNIQVRAVTPQLDELPDVVYHLAGRLSLTSFAASMSIACALVVPETMDNPVKVGLSVFTGLLAAGGWTALLWWHVLGRGKPMRVTPLLRFFRR